MDVTMLRKGRIKKGLSQQALANAVGVHVQLVKYHELLHFKPRFALVKAYAKELGLDPLKLDDDFDKLLSRKARAAKEASVNAGA